MNIYTFKNRRNPIGKPVSLTWPELVAKLREPEITDESIAEYAGMSNEERTGIKDVGGYIAGELEGGRRSKATVKNRCIVTIDADEASWQDWARFAADNPTLCACCHSTHCTMLHSPCQPGKQKRAALQTCCKSRGAFSQEAHDSAVSWL